MVRSKPGSSVSARRGGIGLGKRIENEGLFLNRNSDSCVFHCDLKGLLVARQ